MIPKFGKIELELRLQTNHSLVIESRKEAEISSVIVVIVIGLAIDRGVLAPSFDPF